MNLNFIEDNFEDIYKFYKDDILETNYKIIDNNMSWVNYKKGIFKENYLIEFEKLKNDYQYSFLVKDGAFFQFYYEFKNNILQKAKLSFYPLPKKTRSPEDLDLEMMYDLNEDIQNDICKIIDCDEDLKLTNTSHIRIDFDNKVESHSKCEMQLGCIKNLRIPSKFLITPFLFFDFIYRYIYSDFYKSIYDDKYIKNLKINIEKNINMNLFEEYKNLYLNL